MAVSPAALGPDMDPYAPMPDADPVLIEGIAPTAPASHLPATRPEHRAVRRLKQPRGPKSRLPVAAEVDTSRVFAASAPTLAPAVLQPGAALAFSTFDGGDDQRVVVPPDTAGAVGPRHVFNPLNDDVWFMDRSGAGRRNVDLDAFCASFAGAGIDAFDPKAVFDPIAGRFVFAATGNARRPDSCVLVAASLDDDPNGQWVGAAIYLDPQTQGDTWIDSPSLGFTDDKITISVNLFTRDANRFHGATIYVVDKKSLYDAPHGIAVDRFVLTGKGGTHAPAVNGDPGQATQYLLARWNGTTLVASEITGRPSTGNTRLRQTGFVTTGGPAWQPFPPRADFAPQTGTSAGISVGDDRIQNVVLRNGVLRAVHTVMLPANGPTRSAVQWWRIDPVSRTTLLTGLIDDPSGTVFNAFPSIAVNGAGDALIGMSRFSATTHPSGAAAYLPGASSVGWSAIFAPGLSSYDRPANGDNRWGDYSATMVDPTNDTDFWTVQEFAGPIANAWATKWAKVTAPPHAGLVAGIATPTNGPDKA